MLAACTYGMVEVHPKPRQCSFEAWPTSKGVLSLGSFNRELGRNVFKRV